MLRATAVAVLVAIASSCSSTEPTAADATQAEASAATASATDPPTTSSSIVEAVEEAKSEWSEIVKTNEFNPMNPGEYVSGHLPVELRLATTEPLNVRAAEAGKIEMVALNTGDEYRGVGFFEIDTLVRSDTAGYQIERVEASADISDFLYRLEGSQIVDQGTGELGGVAGAWWRISWSDASSCCWETLFQLTGWQNLWGHAAGYDQLIWIVETPDALLGVVIEAPTESFDEWASQVEENVFDQMIFGSPTGAANLQSHQQAVGPYSIGRFETVVVDRARGISAIVADDGRPIVEAADQRRLLISVTYPAIENGHGAEIVPGPHPLVISAHALHDAGLVLPPEQILSSHGYVVATVRFPETSFPGSAQRGVLDQPADVSFVLDQVVAGVLGTSLTEEVDLSRVGLVGASAGGTTVLGLTASDCCADDRISAVVAHAAAAYDFDSGKREIPTVSGAVPLLQIGSRADPVAPSDSILALNDSWAADAYVALYPNQSHLGWLHPTSDRFDDSIGLVVGFFDRYLRDADVDLAEIAGQMELSEFQGVD